MKHKLSKLENGLRVISIPISSLESTTVTIWVGVGARFEDKKTSGISHFLEHMAFKGSKKRPTAKEIAEVIDGIGGDFNAGTAREFTNFYIKARSGKMEIAFDVLSDMLLNPIIRKKDIERERGVILEEIALKEDTPIDKIGDVFARLVFAGNPLGRDILGNIKSVKDISKVDFENYRKRHYCVENIVIAVSGGISNKQVFELSKKYFSKLEKNKKSQAEKFVANQKSPQVLLQHKDSEQAHLILGFRAYPRVHKDRYVESVLAVILGSGMSSRLVMEIREKRGLAYAVDTSLGRFVDTGVFATYAGVVLLKIDEVVKIILDQHYGIVEGKYPVTAKELDKAKEYIKGRMALAFEDTRYVTNFFGSKLIFMPKIDTPDEVFAKIDKVTMADLMRVAKDIFKPEKLNLAIIGPYKSKERFEKLLH